MALLADHPESDQILVEQAKFPRFAEADGRLDDVLEMLSSY